MKLKLINLMVLVFMAGTAFAQSGSVVFKGTADTAYNGQIIIMYNNTLHQMDSAKVADGKFEISAAFKEPSRYFFYSKYEAKKKHGYAPYGIVVTEASVVTFKADMETITNSVIGNAPENTLYKEYTNTVNAANQELMAKLKEKFGDDYAKHFDKKDSLYSQAMVYYNEQVKPLQAKQLQTAQDFIVQHPSSFSAMLVLSQNFNNLPAADAEALYGKLALNYKQTSYAKHIEEAISSAKLTTVGKIAPDFTQADTAGKMIKLSDFRGKYVLVDFWASWCGPCRAENPNVVAAYQRFHDKGFTVLGVSLDRAGDKDKWLAAIHHDNLMWTQVSDLQFWKNVAAQLYGVDAIPQNFLIGPDGKIIAKSLHGDELTARLSEILK